MIFAVLFSLAIAGQTADQVPRQCQDDNLVDRCAADSQAALRTKLGLPPIEDEAAAGVEIYRAFYVDGYGQDMPAISFERRPGSDPTVVVSGNDQRRMMSPVSMETWNRVRAESVFADRALEAPLPEPQPVRPGGVPRPLPPICLHSWVSTVEMANSTPDGRKVVSIRRRTENTCGGALTTRFAFLMADLAVKAIAPCGVLDTTQQRNHNTILATCLVLEGDRVAAAELRNHVRDGWPRYGLDRLDPGVWRAYLGTNGSPSLTWAGETVATDRSRDNKVAEFIVARLRENPTLRIQPQHFEGVSGRETIVEGVISYSSGEGSAEEAYQANYRQVWIWDPNLSSWMVKTWTVAAFAPSKA